MPTNESKISNTEWGLLIGALLTVDLVQIGLDFLAIGLVLNRFIDIFVGMSLAFYLQIRGQSLANPKRIIGIFVTFIGEQIPAIDSLPFWCLDGIYNMTLSKSDKIIGEIPGVNTISSISSGKTKK